MAETVVSMASSMVVGAISKAASAAAAEMSLLMGVRNDIWFIKDELETMQAFLDAADAMKKKDVLLKVWAKQVRDVSYGIEDCLAEFMVHVRSQTLSQQLMNLKDRHRIAIQIRELKSRVQEVSSRNTRYNLIKIEASSTVDEVDSRMEDVRNHSASNIDEAELVGFDKTKEKLIELVDVNTGHGSTKVICVVGMGGLGKTTLARKVYESKEDIVKNFSCCAWITVSQSFSKIEMLKDMIRQLLGVESLEDCLEKLKGKAVQVEDLAKYLTTELKDKRYFIVLDDLWTIDAWRWIYDISFSSSDEKGNRIMVTTRDVGLAKQITLELLIYHLKPLESVDATSLLLRKSRKTHEDMEKDENLENLVKQLVKKCGRLPLALLTIGGILATKKVGEWKNFYNQLPSELETNPSLEAMRRMVSLSYNHLPSHLKSCFLYLSIFPEDFEIKRRRLVERWIAEGFVSARGGVNIEDVGKSYFNELINRSMIQPSIVGIEGSIKSCRVHDIIRDVMVSISREENFMCLIGDNITSATEENFCHVAYHGGKCKSIDINCSHVRSLTLYGERPMDLSHPICLGDFRMLRALDLEDAKFRITKKNTNNIWVLRHLKYVNIQPTPATLKNMSYKLPRSIGKLQGLQTLHTQRTCSATLPTEITKLRSLRSIRCTKDKRLYQYFEGRMGFFKHVLRLPLISPTGVTFTAGGVGVPRGISNLKELQKLEVVDIKRTSSKALKELGELTQLRKLSVVTAGASEQKYKIFCAAIDKLSSLCSLSVNATHWDGRGHSTGTLEWLVSVSSPPPLLRSLEFYGCFGEMPEWVGSLMHLVKFKLRGSQVKQVGKTLEILGALPKLMLLSLGLRFDNGEKLVFTAGTFLNLRNLDIHVTHQLRKVRFKGGSLPQVETIRISHCRLESGIIGINHLPKLKEISLGQRGKVAKLGLLQEEVDAHPSHPVLRLKEDRSEHDLGGDVVQGSNVELETEESSLREPARGERRWSCRQ